VLFIQKNQTQMIELTKGEKRYARELISQALEKEFKVGMESFTKIIEKYKSGNVVKESYYEMFSAVTDFDKHISQRYDDQRNSQLMNIIISLRYDNYLTDNDLEKFEITTRMVIKRWMEMNEED
jgi:hypothetical protein